VLYLSRLLLYLIKTQGTNALAYFAGTSMTKKKSFITSGQDYTLRAHISQPDGKHLVIVVAHAVAVGDGVVVRVPSFPSTL
jgi:hypothetical protein